MRALLVTLVVLVAAACGSKESSAPVAAGPPSPPATVPMPPATAPPETTVTTTTAPPATTEAPPATTEAPPLKVAPPPPPTAVPDGCAPGSVVPVGTAQRSFAAVVKERAVAYREPGAVQLASFEQRNVNNYPTIFGVLAKRVDERCRPTWYHVQLPLRPNGITGWVRAADVRLERVTTRILVELGERRVILYDRGREVMRALVAVGTSATPTPTGRYYVNQRLIPSDPSGAYGPGAIGISAFSPVLTGWAQGGPIAIHGTNRPELIGQAVSNGCIRVRNDELVRLFERTRAGTPVLVRA
jgi:lipoprotein-anchoring transpeptidase ErfK/SrfK